MNISNYSYECLYIHQVKDGITKDVTVQKVLSFFGAIKQPPSGGGSRAANRDDDNNGHMASTATTSSAQNGSAVMKLDLEDFPLLTPQQVL
jgi:hypothetical protein